MYIFCRQFSALLGAGVTVLDALSILLKQIENKTLEKALADIYDGVQMGNSFSHSAQQYPDIFPAIFLYMVESGELTGNLETSLSRLSDHFEKESKTSNKIKGALTYPIVVMCFAIIAVAVVVIFVIPSFAGVFADVGMEMPAITQMLINVSDFFKNYWYIVLALAVGGTVAYKLYAKTPGGKIALGKLALKIPYVGDLNMKVASSRFSRTLSTTLASGVPLFDALDISGKVSGNKYIEKGIDEAAEKVSQGAALSEPLEKMDVFPPMVVHMVKVGESTGEMEQLLKNTADYYDDEVDTAVAQLTSIMEPLIILVLGVVVTIIVLAVFVPILSMYQGVSNL